MPNFNMLEAGPPRAGETRKPEHTTGPDLVHSWGAGKRHKQEGAPYGVQIQHGVGAMGGAGEKTVEEVMTLI